MAQNCQGDFGQFGRVIGNMIANFGMPAQGLPLSGSQRLLFRQQRRINGDLANIVEPRRPVEGLEFRLAQFQGYSDLAGIAADVVAVVFLAPFF